MKFRERRRKKGFALTISFRTFTTPSLINKYMNKIIPKIGRYFFQFFLLDELLTRLFMFPVTSPDFKMTGDLILSYE